MPGSLLHNLPPSPLLSTSWSGTSTSYFVHFFTQWLSSFRNTCPYQHNLFCCSIKIMSFNPSLLFNSLLGTLSFTLTPHIHLTTHLYPLKCHLIFFSCRPGLTSMQHTTSHTSAVQSPSHYQWDIVIGKQWYPTAWIYSIQFEFWSLKTKVDVIMVMIPNCPNGEHNISYLINCEYCIWQHSHSADHPEKMQWVVALTVAVLYFVLPIAPLSLSCPP